MVGTSKCTMKTIFTEKDKNCCNEKFVSVSDDNEFQLIHTLYCFSLFLFVTLSVFIALKHSTLNVSYLRKKNNNNLTKKNRNLKESHRFFDCVSPFQLNSVWTTLSIAFPVTTVHSISIWVCSSLVVLLFLSIFLSLTRSSDRFFYLLFFRFVFLFHARCALFRVSISMVQSRFMYGCSFVYVSFLSLSLFYFYDI